MRTPQVPGEVMPAFMRFAQRASAVLLAVVVIGSACLVGHSQTAAAPAPLTPIVLPAPQMTGGMPLMQALAKRITTRTFSDKALSPQQLSNLLWAAFGVNRKEMAVAPRPPAPGSRPRRAARGRRSRAPP